ncbi:MAG: hypothetical protein QM754_05335 [Tepidisphaeraceae bacterium]
MLMIGGAQTFGGDVAPDDGLPPLDLNHAVKFTVPSAARAAVAYRLSVTFAGENEQNVDLFMWVQDTNDTGHWQRRAFINSYWQGSESTSQHRLEAGRTYLLALHTKPGKSPGYGLYWSQATLAKSETSPSTAEASPAVRAEFNNGAGANSVASLVPIPPNPPGDH